MTALESRGAGRNLARQKQKEIEASSSRTPANIRWPAFATPRCSIPICCGPPPRITPFAEVVLRHLESQLFPAHPASAPIFFFASRRFFAPKSKSRASSSSTKKLISRSPLSSRVWSAHGVRVDTAKRSAPFPSTLEANSRALEKHIFELAGTRIQNQFAAAARRSSLRQARTCAMPRRVRAKPRSTAADVLEELARVHELPQKVMEYRELTKLKSTYADVLPRTDHPRHRPPAHALRSNGHRHRTPQLVESESAEYSHPHRARPRNSRRVRRRRRQSASLRGLFADRAASPRASSPKIPSSSKRSAAARIFTRAPRRKFSTSRRSRRPASIAAPPKSSISALSTGFPRSAWLSNLEHRAKRSREIHRRVFRALQRRQRLARSPGRRNAHHRLHENSFRPRPSHPGNQLLRSRICAISPNAPP